MYWLRTYTYSVGFDSMAGSLLLQADREATRRGRSFFLSGSSVNPTVTGYSYYSYSVWCCLMLFVDIFLESGASNSVTMFVSWRVKCRECGLLKDATWCHHTEAMNISQSKLRKLATLPTTRAPATGEYFGPVLRQAVLARWMGARRCQKELWGTLKKTRDDKSVQWLDGILCISTAVRIWELQWYIQGFSLVSHDPPNLRRSDRIIIRYIIRRIICDVSS